MTKKEKNLKDIIQALSPETPEITHIILKSQVSRKRKALL